MKSRPVRIKTPESGTLAACLQLLATYRIWHERRNTLPVLVDNGRGGKRPIKVAEPGTADIFATPYISTVKQGTERMPDMAPSLMQAVLGWIKTMFHQRMPQPLWIECKSDSGTQRPAQKDFQQAVEAAGHSYLLVRDVNELVDWLKQRGVI